MAMTKTEATKQGFIINSAPFIREVFDKTKDGYNNIDVKATCDRFSIPYTVIPAMVDLKILASVGEKRTCKFCWKAAPLEIGKIAGISLKIYDKLLLDKNNKKRLQQHTASLKNKNLFPVQGSTRAFSKDAETASILRSMNAIFASTTNNLVSTLPIILDIINKETNNNILSDRILKALLDGKYIVKSRDLGENSLYTWKEVIPSEEHASFIKDMIKEEVVDTKVSRVFNFISFLHTTFKTSTKFSIRGVLKTYGLSNNDQAVIYKELLRSSGHNYVWDYPETPSIMLAEKLIEKIKEYGAKYSKAKSTKIPAIFITDAYKVSHGKMPETNETVSITTIPRIVGYVGHSKTVFDYIKEHGTMTTDKACEITGLNKHSVSNVFWRMKKDGRVTLTGFKTYSYVNTDADITAKVAVGNIAKGESAKPLIEKVTEQLTQPNMDFSKILENMKSRRDELTNELNELNEKITEGENILSLKQKESAFLEYGKKFSSAKAIVTTHLKEQGRVPSNVEMKHSQEAIIEMFTAKAIVTTEELKTRFYPGQKTDYPGCRSLSSMLSYMKNNNIIKNVDKGQYSLVKND